MHKKINATRLFKVLTHILGKVIIRKVICELLGHFLFSWAFVHDNIRMLCIAMYFPLQTYTKGQSKGQALHRLHCTRCFDKFSLKITVYNI